MIISDSTFTGNVANDGEGGFAAGGAVDNESGTMAIRTSSFSGNQALGNSTSGFSTGGFGGAVENFLATISVRNCSFTRNLAGGFVSASGGALDSEDGPSEIVNSTFTDNQAAATGTGGGYSRGGAMANFGDTMTLTNSTFTGNQAVGAPGGMALRAASRTAVRSK